MATYSRVVVETRRVEFRVPAPQPWGATWTEVFKAVHAAIAELTESGQVAECAEPADDSIMIRVEDDMIVVGYEEPTDAS